MRQAQAAGGVFEADGVRIADLKDLAAYIINKVTGAYGGGKGKIPGYGHRYYGLYGKDPRASDVLEIAAEAWAGAASIALATRNRDHSEEEKVDGAVLQRRRRDRRDLVRLEAPAGDRQGVFHHPADRRPLGQLLEQDPGSFFRLQNESVIYIGPAVRS